MFLGAIRLKEDTGGSSLNNLIRLLRDLADDRGRRRGFDALLIMAGYYDEHAAHYERPLSLDEFRCFKVDEEFPVLRRAQLPAQVTAATYTLDLSSIPQPDLGIDGALSALGISE